MAERTKAIAAIGRELKSTGVRIPHLPQTPRDVRSAIPASRLNILNTQWQDGWRVIPQGVVQSPELKRQRKRPPTDGVERDGNQPVSTTGGDEVSSESASITSWCMTVAVTQQHTEQIGSSASPREVVRIEGRMVTSNRDIMNEDI